MGFAHSQIRRRGKARPCAPALEPLEARRLMAGDFAEVAAALPGLDRAFALWGDYDRDGDQDLAMSGFTGSQATSRIYRNDGGTFTDIQAALQGLYYGSGAWGDFDNDGDLDLLLSGNTHAPNWQALTRLYRNDGGTFVDAGAGLPGLYRSAAAWADYDNDGDLDLAISGWTGSASLARVYANTAGALTDSGISLPGLSSGTLAWCDFDSDGDMDLLAGGWNGSADVTRLYRNDGGAFVDFGAALPGLESSSAAWGDYDADGRMDLLLSGQAGAERVTKLYHNQGGTLADTGADLPGVSGGSVAWADYDNDGDLDILLSGAAQTSSLAAVYRNDAGQFVDTGAGLPGTNFGSAAWGDWDGDGDSDLVLTGLAAGLRVTKLYHNDAAACNTAPSAPADLSTTIDRDRITFFWLPANDAQTPQAGLTYNLRVGAGVGDDAIFSGATAGAGNVGAALSWTLHGVRLASARSWSVQAVDGAGRASAWAPVQMLEPPAAPAETAAAGVSATRIRVTWRDNSANEDGFRVERRLGGGQWTTAGTVERNVTSFVDTGLASGDVCEYRVLAFNALGDSDYGPIAGGQTLEVTLWQGAIEIEDGQTAAVDFGSIRLGLPGPTRTFTLRNNAATAVGLSGFSAPAGFTIVQAPPASLNAGDFATFALRLETGSLGLRGGSVSFGIDGQVPTQFDFPVSGMVVNAPPVADAGADIALSDDDGDGQVSVTLDASASRDSDGTIVSYVWRIQGVQVATGPRPTLDLPLGDSTLVLTVTDDCGAAATDAVAVNATNVPPRIASLTPPTGLAETVLGNFEAVAADPGDGPMTYRWDFGDGAVVSGEGLSRPSHAYADNGAYTVNLTVTDSLGATASRQALVEVLNTPPTITLLRGAQEVRQGQQAAFDAAAIDCTADSLTYHWDFGDSVAVGGAGRTGVNHVYAEPGSYRLVLSVTDEDGGTAIAELDVTVIGQAPIIDRLTAPVDLIEGSGGAFSAAAHEAGAAGLLYTWDFGDGSGAVSGPELMDPAHLYLDNGVYTVTLTVDDGEGGIIRQAVSVTVANALPILDAMTIPPGLTAGQTAGFTASARDVAADALTFSWDFGDGSPVATGSAPPHTYAADGQYTVALTVDDGDGGVVTRAANVTVAGVGPTIDGIDAAGQLVEGSLATLTARVAGPMEGLTFEWDFGDGTAPVAGPGEMRHTYASDGQYLVRLTVANAWGNAVGEAGVRIANAAPVLTALEGPDVWESGSAAAFSGQASDAGGDALTWAWDFGDGTSVLSGPGLFAVEHVFAIPGERVVRLTVDDGQGGVAVGERTIVVRAPIGDPPPEETGDDGTIIVTPPGSGQPQIVLGPRHGTISFLDGKLLYQAGEGYFGPDSFQVAWKQPDGSLTTPLTMAVDVPLWLDSRGQAAFTDADGDLVTVALRGGGTGRLLFAGEGGGDIARLVLRQTTASSSLTVRVRRVGGVGQTTIGDLSAPAMKSIDAPTADLAGGLDIGAGLRTLRIDDALPGSRLTIGAGEAAPKSVRLTLDQAQSAELISRAPIDTLAVGSWNGGTVTGTFARRITARGDLGGQWHFESIHSLSVGGNLVDATMRIEAAAGTGAGGPAVGTLAVGGWILRSQFISADGMGTVSAGGIRDSRIDAAAGSGPASSPRPATLNRLIIRGVREQKAAVESFINSTITADRIGAASIRNARLDNGGMAFGLVARQIGSLTYRDGLRRQTWRNIDSPADIGVPSYFDDFEVQVV